MIVGDDPLYLKFWAKQRGQERKTSVLFRVKLHFTWRKSATNFLCVNTASDKVVRHWPIYPCKMICGGRPLLRENLAETDQPHQIADFQSIFARSASAVTSSEKGLINTNRKSTASITMSLRWTVYVNRYNFAANFAKIFTGLITWQPINVPRSKGQRSRSQSHNVT